MAKRKVISTEGAAKDLYVASVQNVSLDGQSAAKVRPKPQSAQQTKKKGNR